VLDHRVCVTQSNQADQHRTDGANWGTSARRLLRSASTLNERQHNLEQRVAALV
jgi:hypothetical protein